MVHFPFFILPHSFFKIQSSFLFTQHGQSMAKFRNETPHISSFNLVNSSLFVTTSHLFSTMCTNLSSHVPSRLLPTCVPDYLPIYNFTEFFTFLHWYLFFMPIKPHYLLNT